MSQSNETSTVYYLQMLDPGQLSPKPAPPELEITMVPEPDFKLNRDFYTTVGARWEWTERLVWNDQQWSDYVDRPQLQTWVARVGGESIGYFELRYEEPGDVEIIYFGLLDQHTGRGYGGPMLSEAVRRAWAFGDVRRVWLHTCTKDHPAALDNYRSRGFEIYDTKAE